MQEPGSVDRFRDLFDANYRALHAYARRRVDSVDADDVVAETFTIAWRRLDHIPAGKELPWLYGVARRVVANRRRGVARFARLQQRLAGEPVDKTWRSHDENESLTVALAKLRPADREVLRLAVWEDLDVDEISVVLGCSPNAAALRLSRARRRLRSLLTEPVGTRTLTSLENDDV